MSQIDVNERWRVLQANYGSMADEELEAVAREAYDLTDLAQQALRAEISRRSLNIELLLHPPATEVEPSFRRGASGEEQRSGYPAGFDPEDWGLISFSHVGDIEQARRLKECFDEAGVPAYFGPDVVDDLRLLPTPFPGTLEVKVREIDLARARAAMSSCAGDSDDVRDEAASDYGAHCPKCHSTEIVFRKLEKSKVQPGEAPKFSWKCDACGYRWKDDGIESQS